MCSSKTRVVRLTVLRSPGTRSQTLFSPSLFCPNTTMKGLLALRRIKHRLSDDFDAFCYTIFGQTPPPTGKRFLFYYARFKRVCFAYTLYDYTYGKPLRHAVFTIDRSVFCFLFISDVFNVVLLKYPDHSLALNSWKHIISVVYVYFI